jgi:hypothetical protein
LFVCSTALTEPGPYDPRREPILSSLSIALEGTATLHFKAKLYDEMRYFRIRVLCSTSYIKVQSDNMTVKYLPLSVSGSTVIDGGITVPTVISTGIRASRILSPVV